MGHWRWPEHWPSGSIIADCREPNGSSLEDHTLGSLWLFAYPLLGQQPQLYGLDGGLRAVGDVQLGDDPLEVPFHGRETYVQLLGDEAIGLARYHAA
jgi:hypothetical protein